MRILLAHNSLYAGSFGGGDKSNRLLMEALAGRGHSVRVVARVEHFTAAEARKLVPSGDIPPVLVRDLDGVEVHTLLLDPRIRSYIAGQIELFDPDIIITSTDDPAQLLFDAALSAPRARVVHLVRATIAVPFGPDSSARSAARSDLLRRADLIVGVSEYVARYIREYGRMDAVHVPISLMEPREWPVSGRFENRYITLVNPCAVKGIDIFTGLAGRLPDLEFAAVPTWGTNAEDSAKLRRYPNIIVIPPVSNIDTLLSMTRVMLVPSLWAEARSRMVVEAMLGGVPVVASNIGGIPEAKLGVPYLIPVNPVTSYSPSLDENMVPVANVPPQDLDPWEAALRRLSAEPEHWTQIAEASRDAALQYAQSLSVEPFERLLIDVASRPKKSPPPAVLSPERQQLYALRIKQKAWFPNAAAATPEQTRLFCFPHAGAGATAYRGWNLGPHFAVCPALLPGREARQSETPIEDMTQLVAELMQAIRPWLATPFAFFGHSMGAGIAFEVTRVLRTAGLPQPHSLIVSGARAPQLRLNWTPGPKPTDEELLALSGGLALPALRADTNLYRLYRYLPAPPLGMPLYAYGGRDDSRVTGADVEAWHEQTTGPFKRREFPGGHFYLQDRPGEFLKQLAEDLQPGVTGDL